MIEKNDNGKFFPPKKDPSCFFLPTADDSGRVHPGEFLFIKDPGDNIPSALREIRYSGSTKDSAGFSVTYNYLTQKPESTDSSRFFLEKNYNEERFIRKNRANRNEGEREQSGSCSQTF